MAKSSVEKGLLASAPAGLVQVAERTAFRCKNPAVARRVFDFDKSKSLDAESGDQPTESWPGPELPAKELPQNRRIAESRGSASSLFFHIMTRAC
ncbi:hypothetical protein NKJ06_05425 [Mesorhizobium sp. M0293]|uniref:hypothetical protein n=1 Tax=Mesorhizobium sp. M0293 TaxID=2956930 RepID=UPI00333DE3AB